MARRPNYGAEKRQKEIQRQKKKEDKLEKRRLKREAATSGDGPEVQDDDIEEEEGEEGDEGEEEPDGPPAESR